MYTKNSRIKTLFNAPLDKDVLDLIAYVGEHFCLKSIVGI